MSAQVTSFNGAVLFDLTDASPVTRTEAAFLPGHTTLSWDVVHHDHAHVVALTPEALQFAVRNSLNGYDTIAELLAARAQREVVETARAAAAEHASEARDSVRRVALANRLYPFQRAGVAYALDYARFPGRAIIGDTMGLGKSAQAIATLESREAYPAVVVVPAGLRSNWKCELAQWVPGRTVAVLTDRTSFEPADVYVMAYDSLDAWSRFFLNEESPMGLRGLVFDEVHRIKNQSAQRTQAARRLATLVPEAGVILGLTGTVVVNRPAELIEPLKTLGVFHKIFGSVESYRSTYCSSTTSVETLYDLNQSLRANCYVRRTMDEVMDDYPTLMAPQVHLIDVLPVARLATYRSIESDVVEYVRAAKGDDAAASTAKAAALVQLGYLRHEIGRVKVVETITWTRTFLAETERSLIVFAWHEDVQSAIVAGLRTAGVEVTALSGGMTDAEVALAVNGFQAGDYSVIVCSLQAASEGHTLTAANDVLFAELPWTSAMYDQAVARARRIGQTADKVFSHNLLVADSIDTRLAEILDDKRVVTTAVTDGDVQASLLNSLAA